MEPDERIGWNNQPIPDPPKDIYTIHDWSAVDEAVRLYNPGDVDLFVHPNASLRFANEFVKEFKTGAGAAKEGYPVLNPGIAYCKAEVFHCLQPHVNALGDWAQSIRSQITKVEALTREMLSKYNNAQRNIFPPPSPESQVLQPLAITEKVYLQITKKRGLDLVAAAAKKHLPAFPEKCASLADISSAQPSKGDVQTELYKNNLQFLQGKLGLLLSFEEQVKKIHQDMDTLLLGNTSVGSARTVMDFMDINLMKGKAIKTVDRSPMTKDKSPRSKNKSPRNKNKSPRSKDKSPRSKNKSPTCSANSTDDAKIKIGGNTVNSTSPKTKSPVRRNKSPQSSVNRTGGTAESKIGGSKKARIEKSPERCSKKARVEKKLEGPPA